MTTPPDRTRVAAVFIALVAVCLAPDVVSRPIRSTLRDALVPCRAWLVAQKAVFLEKPESLSPTTSQPPESVVNRILALELEVARLRQRERDNSLTGRDGSTNDHTSLVLATVVPARLLGEQAARYWRTAGALTVGKSTGVQEAALVIDARAPLVDAGEKDGVTPGDMVRTGSAVVGLVGDSGRWSSLFRPLTHKEFKAGARLARRNGEQIVFAADGVLQGDGESGCELRLIPPTVPVQVGDLVVTSDVESHLSEPLVFGEIVEAQLPDNALEWTIRVRPSVDWRTVSNVCVIRMSVNRDRLLAN